MFARVRTLSAVLAIASLSAACTGVPTATRPVPPPTSPTSPTCETADGTPITAAFVPFTSRWGDAVGLADSTPRMNLSGPVGQLQAIRRDVETTNWPPCAQRAADLLTDGMNSEISGYLVFMAGHTPEETRTLPDVGTITYGYLSRVSSVAEADRIFDAQAYDAITRGRQAFDDFSTELAYAAGEQTRPS